MTLRKEHIITSDSGATEIWPAGTPVKGTEVSLDAAVTFTRRIWRSRICMNSLLYSSRELRQLGSRVSNAEVKFDPCDLGQIPVRHPDGRFICVPAIDYAYAKGLSMFLCPASAGDGKSVCPLE